MIHFLKLMLQLALVTLSVVLGRYASDSFSLVPCCLPYLPAIDSSSVDLATHLKVIVTCCGGAFLAGRLLLGWEVFSTARRTGQEVYVLLTGIVAASLYLYVFATDNFILEWLFNTSVICLVLFAITYLALGFAENIGVEGRIGILIKDVLEILKKPAALAVLIYAVSPLVSARQNLTDQDFANCVSATQVSANVTRDCRNNLD